MPLTTRETELEEQRRRFAAACELELPVDHPRTPRSSMTIGRERTLLPDELAEALEALRRTLDARFESVLVAGLGSVVYRYAGEAKPVVGVVPDHPERLLPLPFEFGADTTFASVVRSVERELAGDAAQGVPLELLRGDGAGGDHLPRVLFAALGPPDDPAITGPDTTDQRYDLALVVETGEREVFTTLEFDSALFEHATIRRMLGYLQTLLRAGAAAPETPVRGLPFLPPTERDLVLRGWNRTMRPYPAVCVHDLVAERATASPDALAATFGGDTLTYAELERRSNQLGHILQALDVGADAPVGVSAEPSLDLVVGLLGVLKSGGAIVPVDPGTPTGLQRLVLEDAGVRALLTRGSLERGRAPDGARMLFLDDDREWIGAAASEPPDSAATPGALACVLYGSGRTGTEITHGSLVNLLGAVAKRPGVRAEDVLLAVPALSSHVALLGVFLPLSVGARLVVCPNEVAADPVAFASLLDEEDVTVALSTPSMWRTLVEAGWPGRPRLRLLSAGAATPPQLAEELLRRKVELWSLYGAPEATICSAVSLVESPASTAIGRPIANTSLYILDEELEPLPIGLPGELYIGGHGLARGYHNRPDETARRFVRHPFDCRPSTRLFRTGDVARYRADGSVELLGTVGDEPERPEEEVYGALRARLDQRLAALWPRRRG